MRLVCVKIIYDMDDPNKALADELFDWYSGNVTVLDLLEADPDMANTTITIKEERGE